jgi:outer membrane protein TolC
MVSVPTYAQAQVNFQTRMLTLATPLVMGVLLSGCITSHDEPVEKALDDPAALGLSATLAPATNSEWWSAYCDPQLDRLLREALTGSPTLAQSLARERKAQADAAAVQTVSWPLITYDAFGIRKRFSDHDPVPPIVAGKQKWLGSQGFNLSWDLDFWGRQAALIAQADARSDASAFDSAGARLAIAGAVVRSYLALDRAYALADVAERSQQQRQEILGITQRRLRAGLDTRVEQRQAEGAVWDTRVELTQLLAERERIVHLLAALAGQGATAHSKILAARSRIASAHAGLRAARAAFYPDINLLAFAGTSAIGFDNLFNGSSRTFGIGSALHLPVFDAGRLKALYRGSAAEVDLAVDAYNQTVLAAVQETADQISDISSLDTAIEQQHQSVDAAEDAFSLATERYRAGLTTYLSVLITESAVLSARRQLVTMVTARNIARVTLLIDVGGDFQLPRALEPVVH